jgi:outer membrane protein assembly factor BamB
MRCPNGACRKVFVVDNKEPTAPKPKPDAPPPPAAKGQRSGAVGDMVPILPAADASAPKKEAGSWRDAPPPARTAKKPADGAPPAAKPKPKPVIPQGKTIPEIAKPSWDAPPPVRRKDLVTDAPAAEAPEQEDQDATAKMDAEQMAVDQKITTEPSEEKTARDPSDEHPVAHVGRRRAYGLIIILLLLMLGVGGGVALYFVKAQQGAEDQEVKEAFESYEKQDFRIAAGKFRELQQKFGSGARKNELDFYEKISTLRAALNDPAIDPDKGLTDLAQFIQEQKGAVDGNGQNLLRLPTNGPNLGTAFTKLVESYASKAVPAKDDTPLAVVKRIEDLKETISNWPKGLSDEDATKVKGEIDKVSKSVDRWVRHEDMLKRLQTGTGDKSLNSLRMAQAVLRSAEEEFPDLAKEEAVVAVFNGLYDGHRASVTYQEKDEDLEKPQADRSEPSLGVAPLIRGTVGTGEGVDLVTARGVLYALERTTGQCRWALRVGGEVASVPVRLPPTLRSNTGRERFLVLSDENAISASVLTLVDEDGGVAWRYSMKATCLGRPLLIDQRAFVPTTDGRVHVLDVKRGRLLGQYRLGQRLSTGGTQEGNKPLLWFAGDEECVFVLDVDKPKCAAIYYTGHPAGSLRGPPILVTPENADGYLILNQTAGVDETLLRVYKLPIGDRRPTPLKLDAEPRLRGWTWFTAHADDEKVAAVTDAGRLGLFGIKQSKNSDGPLFPLLPGEYGGLKLDLYLEAKNPSRSRSQLVHARGDDLWVLAFGILQRIEVCWQNPAGRTLRGSWKTPLDVGLPLHAVQVAEDPNTDHVTLILATQPARQQIALATAVDDETGTVRWQRQLGLVCRDAPVPMGTDAADPAPLLLALDQSGALISFDPLVQANLKPGLAQTGGLRVADAVDDNPLVPPQLFLSEDGKTAYEVACPGRGKQLLLRQVIRDTKERKLKLEIEKKLDLKSPLGGTPAVVGNRLLLPLESGVLAVVQLPADKSEAKETVNWRDGRLGADARGHVIPLGPDRFLTTDGLRGVTTWKWPADRQLPAGRPGRNKSARVPVTFDLKARLTGAPLVLPGSADGKQLPRVCLADADGRVLLLDVTPEGDLSIAGDWDVKGQVTAGPFAATAEGADRIGCVVDGRHLLWLDPARDRKEVWRFDADADIVGEPRLLDGVLMVALVDGTYLRLDPAKGKPVGETVIGPPGVAPTAAPVAFGPGRLFAPLADGTVLVPKR